MEAAKNGLFCRVFILYANAEDARSIFQEIDSRNMTEPGFVWLVSEQALQAPNRPNGVLALKLNSLDESSMISDSVQVLANALKEMYSNENITVPPTDCGKIATSKWQSGIKFMDYLKNQTFNGKTGRIAFDEFGDRLLSDYEVINTVEGSEESVGKYWFSKTNMKMELELEESRIVWPGRQFDKPLGNLFCLLFKLVLILKIIFRLYNTKALKSGNPSRKAFRLGEANR